MTRMQLPRTWRSIDVTFLTVPLLEMALKSSGHIEALEAEGADEPLLGRVPVLVCSCRGIRHRLCLLGDVLQEIHLLSWKSAASHPWVWWGSAPLSFPLSPQNDRRGREYGELGRQVGFGSAGQQSAANTEQPQQVEKTHDIGIRKTLTADQSFFSMKNKMCILPQLLEQQDISGKGFFNQLPVDKM